MFDWFAARGISRETVTRAGVTIDNGWVKFPYTIRWKPVNHKYRKLGAKEFRKDRGGQKTLYGLDFIPVGCKELVVVEGEMDVLACREAGIQHVVSVPDGAPSPDDAPGSKIGFLDAPQYESFINPVPSHIIAVDEDAPGQRLRDDLVRRIGYERCKTVSWHDPETGESAKDANEWLVKYGPDSLRGRIAAAKDIPVTGVFYVREIVALMAVALVLFGLAQAASVRTRRTFTIFGAVVLIASTLWAASILLG